MTVPTPRPALRKAPDAHIHPADPGRTTGAPPPPRAPAKAPTLTPVPALPRLHRLAGPPHGTTSDSLRAGRRDRGQRQAPAKAAKARPPKEKKVDLTVRIPKSLRKDLRAAAKAAGRTPDEVVTALLRSWIDN